MTVMKCNGKHQHVCTVICSCPVSCTLKQYATAHETQHNNNSAINVTIQAAVYLRPSSSCQYILQNTTSHHRSAMPIQTMAKLIASLALTHLTLPYLTFGVGRLLHRPSAEAVSVRPNAQPRCNQKVTVIGCEAENRL